MKSLYLAPFLLGLIFACQKSTPKPTQNIAADSDPAQPSSEQVSTASSIPKVQQDQPTPDTQDLAANNQPTQSDDANQSGGGKETYPPAFDFIPGLDSILTSAECAEDPSRSFLPNLKAFKNPQGLASTFSSAGANDLNNAFFKSLGSNDRACASCHDPRAGWTITPEFVQHRFQSTGGLHPLFRTNDGSNSPNADVSTIAARTQAYNLLLSKGLIRVGLPIPENAEFELTLVEDPYNYASAKELSLFRRPLPSTNLKFITNVMWDGRESPALALNDNLKSQANTATVGHAQGMPLTDAIRQDIVTFETSLFSAQIYQPAVGTLSGHRASGGAVVLSQQPFSFGMNRAGSPEFTRNVFTLYKNWANHQDPVKASIARGEEIFNNKTFVVRAVKGLNDAINVAELTTTCSGCHNTPNVGSNSGSAFMDIGIASGAFRKPDMPRYTLKNLSTGEIVTTTDPGRALVTGKWADIGKFKIPVIRNLAARAPYFHNGNSADLPALVDFYNRRFTIGLTDAERQDLEAFLSAL